MKYHRKTLQTPALAVVLVLALLAFIRCASDPSRRACALVIFPDGESTNEDFEITTPSGLEDVVAYYDALLQPTNHPEVGGWQKTESANGTCIYACLSSNVIQDSELTGCICISEVGGATQIVGYRYRSGGSFGCQRCVR